MANLTVAMGTMDTSMSVSDTSGFTVNGGVVLVDSEQMQYTTATDRTLIGLTRGVHGTSAATHAVGASITVVESAPFLPVVHILEAEAMNWPTLSLTDPSAVPTAAQIDANMFIMVLLDNSGANQTWTLPLITAPQGRQLSIGLATASTKTLSVNSTSIAAGSAHLFTWTGSAWLV